MDMQTHDFFLLRRPLLSKENLFDFHRIVGSDPERFQEEILKFFSAPLMQQAIFLASPQLHDQLLKSINQKTSKDQTKLCYSLYKYLVRMSTRCTPYGLFAGCQIGDIQDGADSRFKMDDRFRVHFSLDAHVQWALNTSLTQKDAIESITRFYPNTSMTRTSGSYRYIERQSVGFTIAEAEANDYTESLLKIAKKGVSKTEMIQVLEAQQVTSEDASVFVQDMIHSQILVGDLELGATGSEWLQSMIDRIKPFENLKCDLERLLQIKSILNLQIPVYDKSTRLSKVLTDYGLDFPTRHILKADIYWEPAVCGIKREVIETLTEELKNLLPLSSFGKNPDLENFAIAFSETYQQQEMPLLTVLDHEYGIGYGNLNPISNEDLLLLDGIDFNIKRTTHSCPWSKLSQLKLRLYEKALTEKLSVIDLEDMDFTDFSEGPEPVSEMEGFYILGNMITDNISDLDGGRFKFVAQAMGAPSGFSLLSRFCHGDHVLEGMILQGITREEFSQPEVIFAEINHLADPATGNVLSRPNLRKYEIPYLSASTVKTENQILPSDLLISVTADHKVILRSKRLGKRIIPRLTSAHNFVNGLPVYRFLCDVATQGTAGLLHWDWDYLSECEFLPRIEYKHWIVSKATWNIDLSKLSIQPPDLESYSNQWSQIRQRLNIVDPVQLVEGDNLFLIDSDFAVKILFDALYRQGKVQVTEYLEKPDRGLLQVGCQHYANEIVIPVLTNGLPDSRAATVATSFSLTDQREFLPGSDWLYLKIYCAATTAEQLLAGKLSAFFEQLLAKKIIRKWFFVRYQDPKPHLRLRFKRGISEDFWVKVTDGITSLLQIDHKPGEIQKVCLDTYERELERYPHIRYDFTEDIFCADSTLVINLLKNNKTLDRWKLALRGIDIILDDLGYSISQKSNLASNLQASFLAEFKDDQNLIHQLNLKYRKYKREIYQIMNKAQDQLTGFESLIYLFEARTRIIAQQERWPKAAPEFVMDKLVSSFIHMHLNRLFITNHREQELVIYHYLKKYYNSIYAQIGAEVKKQKNNVQNLQVTDK